MDIRRLGVAVATNNVGFLIDVADTRSAGSDQSMLTSILGAASAGPPIRTAPLHDACLRGHAEVRMCLCLCFENTLPSFCIRLSVFMQQCAKILVEYGAAVNVPGEHGWTPLHLAAMQGHIGCVTVRISCTPLT